MNMNKLSNAIFLHKVKSPSKDNLETSNYVVARFFDSMSDIYNMMDQTPLSTKNTLKIILKGKVLSLKIKF